MDFCVHLAIAASRQQKKNPRKALEFFKFVSFSACTMMGKNLRLPLRSRGRKSIVLELPPNTHCRSRSAGWVSCSDDCYPQSHCNTAELKVSFPSPRFVHKVLNCFHHKYFSFQCKPSYLHKGSCIFRVSVKKEPTISRKLSLYKISG